MKNYLVTSMLLVLLLTIVLQVPAFADDGVKSKNKQCKSGTIKVFKITNKKPICLKENTAKKLEQRGLVQIVNDEKLTQNPKSKSNLTVLSTSKNTKYIPIPVESNVKFSGNVYGHAGPMPLRAPLPYLMFEYAGVVPGYYNFIVENTPTPLLAQGLEATITDPIPLHPYAMNYTKWVPRYIPAGYKIAVISVEQPTSYLNSSALDVTYLPNTISILPQDLTNYQFYNITSISINVKLRYDDEPMSQSWRDRLVKYSQTITVTEEYGGILERIYVSPADPNIKAVIYLTNHLDILVSVRGLPFIESEKILLSILETSGTYISPP